MEKVKLYVKLLKCDSQILSSNLEFIEHCLEEDLNCSKELNELYGKIEKIIDNYKLLGEALDNLQ